MFSQVSHQPIFTWPKNFHFCTKNTKWIIKFIDCILLDETTDINKSNSARYAKFFQRRFAMLLQRGFYIFWPMLETRKSNLSNNWRSCKHSGYMYQDKHSGYMYQDMHSGYMYPECLSWYMYQDMHSGYMYQDMHSGYMYQYTHSGQMYEY